MLLTEFDEEGWEWAVREDGKEEGRLTEKKKIARRMLLTGDDTAHVSDCTGLTQKEVRKLQKKLLQPARAR